MKEYSPDLGHESILRNIKPLLTFDEKEDYKGWRAKVKEKFTEKTITVNDIRARIVSVSSSIMKQFDPEQKNVKVLVNGSKQYCFNIIRGRNYFGSVTAFLRDYNMISMAIYL